MVGKANRTNTEGNSLMNMKFESAHAAWNNGTYSIPIPLQCFVIGGILDTPEKVQEAAQMSDLPRVEELVLVLPKEATGIPQVRDLSNLPIYSVDGQDVVKVCIITTSGWGRIRDYARCDHVKVWYEGSQRNADMAGAPRPNEFTLNNLTFKTWFD
ncbi:hypothetical protein CPB84DRAFT_1754299 [Gymnopilus junonius]|uniref:Uncharacterized protein n=1 Tax=Gymnopilus junonius TaxID=109634 RepID=A0A9P5N721_GYMJU|nr:hypothetical protein CPB84DRAFT_1754299 [Gymnopilus junonius]